jgi:hypothetical protein
MKIHSLLIPCVIVLNVAYADNRDPRIDHRHDEDWARQWAAGAQRPDSREATVCRGERCWHTLSFSTSILRETLNGNVLLRRESCRRSPALQDIFNCTNIDWGVGECVYFAKAQDEWHLGGVRQIIPGHTEEEALAMCAE